MIPGLMNGININPKEKKAIKKPNAISIVKVKSEKTILIKAVESESEI